MSFFRLNGWTLPIRLGSATQAREKFSALARAWTNRPLGNNRGTNRSWASEVCRLAIGCADTLEGLLARRFHRWSFDTDLWSTTGYGPQAGYTGGIVPSWTGARFGTGYAVLTSVTWNLKLRDDKWTVGVWRLEAGEWNHYWVRSDGAKWVNGVRNDAASTTWLTVSDGGVLLTSGTYDEMTVLEFNGCGEFLVAAYLWMSGDGVVAYWPLDRHGLERIEGQLAANTGVAFFAGQVGGEFGAAQFNAAADVLSYATQTRYDVDADGRFSLQFWAKIIDAIQRNRWVINKASAAGNDPGWGMRIDPALFEMVWELRGDVSETFDVKAAIPTDGAWHHFAGTWGGTSGDGRIYVDGKLKASGNFVFGDSIQNADPVRFGGTFDGRSGFIGDLDEVRFHHEELTAEAVLHYYECGKANLPAPVDQPFSDAPYLVLDGRVVGCRQVDVLGNDPTAVNQQGGKRDDTGFANNLRDVRVLVDEEKFRPSKLPLSAAVAWNLDTRLEDGSLIIPAQGGFSPSLALASGLTGRLGPWGWGEAFEGTGATVLDLPFNASGVTPIVGQSKVTVLAIVRHTNDSNIGTVIHMTDTGSSTKLRCVWREDELSVEARADPGDILQTFTDPLSGQAADTVDFHTLMFGVDIDEQELFLGIDGERTSDGATFPTAVFSDDFGTGHRIGRSQAATDPIEGLIAHVSVIPGRILTEEEFRVWGENARQKGVF